MDPQLTSSGKPYGPERYKKIVQERYLNSKNMNTSYNDIGKITPTERQYLIEFIADEIKRSKELVKEEINKRKK